MRRGNYPLLTAAVTGSGALGPNECSGARQIEVSITFGAGTSAGAGGTWASESVVNWAAASRTHKVIITGGRQAIQARISTAIVGGTVDAVASITD